MTKTEIANLALSHAREQALNGNVETTTELLAETVLLHYDQSLREVLARVRPNFAQKRMKLTQDATAPAFDWSLQYILPTDFIEIVKFNGADGGVIDDSYEIEGRRLLTEQDEARIVYIRFEEDTSLYDADFVDAFSLLLASKIVNARRGDQEQAQTLQMASRGKASESAAKSAHARRRYNSRDIINRSSRWTGSTRRVSTNESTNGDVGVSYD